MIYIVIAYAFVLLLAWLKHKGFVSDIMAIQLFCIAILLGIADIKKDIESLKEQSK